MLKNENSLMIEVFFQKFLRAIVLKESKHIDLYYNVLTDYEQKDAVSFNTLGSARIAYFKKLAVDFLNNTSTRSFDLDLLYLLLIRLKISSL